MLGGELGGCTGKGGQKISSVHLVKLQALSYLLELSGLWNTVEEEEDPIR